MVLRSWAVRTRAGGTQEPLQCPGPSPGPKGGEQMDSIKEDMCVVPELFFIFGEPTLLQQGLIVELDFA